MVVFSGVLMVSGAALALIAGIGLQRFDDVFARMHAATKPATLGVALVLVGAALQVPDPGDVAKLLLVVVLQFLTAPVGSHLIGRAAYRSGTEVSDQMAADELAGVDTDQ
jgi:multicomponent Na+:H+ antiporter subunit G